MADKECWRIVEDARTQLDNKGPVGAFVERLVRELETGFCNGRVCEDCPVSLVLNGAKDVALTSREGVVCAVTSFLSSSLSESLSLQDS